MRTAAIELKNVSKKYRLYDTSKHRVLESLLPLGKKYHREFWALRDVSLEIPRGATVGILGVNGSGKSTLLQLISSILEPSSGTVSVSGKVAALIELGAGFNPQLTGRENAEVNCMILGLTGREARAKIPEIEAFADIGEFFDQPVRTYSSGMFMRVAFATAISVEPDVLIIDEALAVGDAKFQQKCFRKFQDFQSAGKTILVVTHDRSMVPRLCTHGILLHQGRLIAYGSPKDITDQYGHILVNGYPPVSGDRKTPEELPRAVKTVESRPQMTAILRASSGDDSSRCETRASYNRNERAFGIGGAEILDYLLVTDVGEDPVEVESGTSLTCMVKIRFDSDVERPLVGFSIKTRDGVLVYGTNSGWLGIELASRKAGETAVYRLNVELSLGADDWFIDLAVARNIEEILHTREAVIHLKTTAPRLSTGIVTLDANISDDVAV